MSSRGSISIDKDKDVSLDESKLSADAQDAPHNIHSALLPDESNPFFVRDLDYTPEEEKAIIKVLDRRLFPWILLTTFVLNMDRCIRLFDERQA